MNRLIHFQSSSLRRFNVVQRIKTQLPGSKFGRFVSTKADKSVIAKLTLADGTIFKGISFGAESPVAGEVVFSTGMVGYTESLTDPSFRGQVIT